MTGYPSKLFGFIKIVKPGEMLPRGYGIVFHRACWLETVTAPLPFSTVMRGVHLLYQWFRYPFRFVCSDCRRPME